MIKLTRLTETELKVLWYDQFEALAVINAGLIRGNEKKVSIENNLRAINQRLADKQKTSKHKK